MSSGEREMDKFRAAKEKYGRDVRVFETIKPSEEVDDMPGKAEDAEADETDDFYELTTEDYYRLQSSKKPDGPLKTRKIREAEQAAHRARYQKAVIRVRFPDNHTFEANFHPSETLQSLVDLVKKVVLHPELPFYLYTTPPKKQLKDLSQDFYSAGFVPGAIVYFSYDLPKDHEAPSSPFLQEEVMSLKGLESVPEPQGPAQVETPAEDQTSIPPLVRESKPTEKKVTKPKWLKL